MNIYRFAGGKIVEEWFLEDTMGLLRQLGFMPAEE
jgi:predicted ester cyclase